MDHVGIKHPRVAFLFVSFYETISAFSADWMQHFMVYYTVAETLC